MAEVSARSDPDPIRCGACFILSPFLLELTPTTSRTKRRARCLTFDTRITSEDARQQLIEWTRRIVDISESHSKPTAVYPPRVHSFSHLRIEYSSWASEQKLMDGLDGVSFAEKRN